MCISTRGDYGMWALFDLAQHYGQGLVQSEDMATRQGIPVKYLNQVLTILRRAGLIDSLRGPLGGHRLARPPEQITVLEALNVLEGPLMQIDLGREDLIPTQPEDREIIRDVWRTARHNMENLFQSTTLADLCQRKQQQEEYVMYYI